MEIALIFCSTLKDRAYTRICRRFRLLSVRGVMKLSAVQISLDVRQDALALTLGQPRFALEIAGASINAQAQERAGRPMRKQVSTVMAWFAQPVLSLTLAPFVALTAG